MNHPSNEVRNTLIEVAASLSTRGWLRATSGNLSVKDAQTGIIYITKSGVNKEHLVPADIIGMDRHGSVLDGVGQPSYETVIHLAIYDITHAGAILHVHTIFNNLVTRFSLDGGVTIDTHEMLKALGHWDENASVIIPVVPNYRDLARVAQSIRGALNVDVPGIILDRHGVYAFGHTVKDAQRHLEALEFLFEWLYWDRMPFASPAYQASTTIT